MRRQLELARTQPASRFFWLAVLAHGCADPAVAPPSTPTAETSQDNQDGGFIVEFPSTEPAAAPEGADADAAPEIVLADVPAPAEDAMVASEVASDAGPDVPDGACSSPLVAGDLTIDELMIASVAGTGDYGEWLEVRSTLGCWIDLQGLHGECPRGAVVATFDVTESLWIPPDGTFVIADSSDPAVNHNLPGPLIVWAGRHGDILRNKGTTITLSLGSLRVDSITYPAIPPSIGQSLAFPSDCDVTLRSDWTRWRTSTEGWFPGFLGTPNAPNGDVHCP